MNGYLVDTNIPSELTRDTPDPRVMEFLENAARETVFLSVMTVGEICKGIDLLPAGRKRDLALHPGRRFRSRPRLRVA